MKTDRCGLDRIEHWILATLPSVVTIPIKKVGSNLSLLLPAGE